MGERLLCPVPDSLLVGGNGTDQPDSARGPGRRARLCRMVIVSASRLQESPLDRQRPTPRLYRHDRGHLAANGSAVRNRDRHADQARAALLSSRTIIVHPGSSRPALAQRCRRPDVCGSRERPSVTSAARSVTWSTARKVTDPCRIYLSSVTA
jgi:hypothetical protein